jgi:DNA-binding NtrC family response regulator
MDGLETYRAIRQIRPNQKVIIASGYTKSDRILIALQSGVISSLKKPYLIQELGTAVRGALKTVNPGPDGPGLQIPKT